MSVLVCSPDGRVYQVGDEGNMCESVACDGGIHGACPGGETEGAFRKVICAPPKVRSPNAHKNVVIENDPNVGVWGGTCTCPDGEVYLAGVRAQSLHCCELAACRRRFRGHDPMRPRRWQAIRTTSVLVSRAREAVPAFATITSRSGRASG